MDLGKHICESILLEFDPITGAIAGAGIGAGINAAKWAKQRYDLRKQMKNCGNDPECKKNIQNRISYANKQALRKTAIGTVGGAALVGGAGALAPHMGAIKAGASAVGSGAMTGLGHAANIGVKTGQTMMGVTGVMNAVNMTKQMTAQDNAKAQEDVIQAQQEAEKVREEGKRKEEEAREKAEREKERVRNLNA